METQSDDVITYMSSHLPERRRRRKEEVNRMRQMEAERNKRRRGRSSSVSGFIRGALLKVSTSSISLTSLLFSLQVRISVRSSTSHADSLNLEVISNRPHLSSAPQQPSSRLRSQLVQEVRQAEEAQAQEKSSRLPKLSKEEREFRQSKKPNLYSLLEEVRELALRDLDTLSLNVSL